MDLINLIIDYSTDFISHGGVLFGFFLVFIECFIPALPLSVFVALNINAFGLFIGCLISWLATSLGSFICYFIFYYIEGRLTEKFLNRKLIKKISNSIDRFKRIKFTELVLIITLPFTPSFLINILAGIILMKKEKFMIAILIGKFFSILFWGLIGKTFIESIMDVKSIVYIITTLIISYLISMFVSHKMKIN